MSLVALAILICILLIVLIIISAINGVSLMKVEKIIDRDFTCAKCGAKPDDQ